jgi:hypothetical protein
MLACASRAQRAIAVHSRHSGTVDSPKHLASRMIAKTFFTGEDIHPNSTKTLRDHDRFHHGAQLTLIR